VQYRKRQPLDFPQTLVKFAPALNVEPHKLFKPAEALPPEMPLILNKCLDEAVVAANKGTGWAGEGLS